jgi:hypothetical protein
VIPQNKYLILSGTSDDAKCLVHVLGQKAHLVIQIQDDIRRRWTDIIFYSFVVQVTPMPIAPHISCF